MKKKTLLFLILLIIWWVSYAINTLYEWRRIAKNGGSEMINAYNECRVVTNNRINNDIFVPINSSSEWLLFRNNTPTNVDLWTCGCKTNADCSVWSICSGYVAPTTSYCGGMYYFPNYYSWSCQLASNSYDMSYWAWQTTILNAKAVDTVDCYSKLLSYGGAWYGRNTSYYNPVPCYLNTTPSTCSAVSYT